MMSTTAQRRAKGKMRPPPKKTGSESATDAEWSKLALAIKEIQQHNASKLSFEEHYRYSYNMVLHKHGDRLYAGVKRLISEHLYSLAFSEIIPTFPRSGVMSSSSSSGGVGASSSRKGLTGRGGAGGTESVEMVVEGERFLNALKAVWEDHMGSMGKLGQILKYMDKVYTPSAAVPPCALLALHLFLSDIIHSTSYPISAHLYNTLLTQIHLERQGEVINRSAMRDAVEILNRLNVEKTKGSGGARLKTVYEVEVEGRVLKRSEEFYREEGERLLESCDASTYLRKVEARIAEEQARCSHYLLPTTLAPLMFILDTNLLSYHLLTILNMSGSGLVPMLDQDAYADLRRVYYLFRRENVKEGMDTLKRALKASIMVRGEAVNEGVKLSMPASTSAASTVGGEDVDMDGADSKGKQPVRPTGTTAMAATSAALRWVQEVLDLKDKFGKILSEGFEDDKAVETAINEAFQTFINQNQKAAEYISLFIDENLKKGLKGKTEDEVDLALEKTIILFRFLIDKDVFERYYKSHLAKRLLNGRSVSEDAEKSMVAKLKVESGYQFTQKLEGMFQDIRLSTDTMKAFERQLGNDQPLGMDLNVTVLTSTFWPGESSSTACIFSPLMNSSIARFEKFYHSRHSGRKLTWQAAHGNADVRVQFKAKRHELNVSTHGLVILLLFDELDEGEELSLQDIKSATQIPDAELARGLQSLACGKYRILSKSPKSRDIGANDRFSFNSSFTCPLAKIKIQTIVGKVENNEERKETQDKVDEERKHQVEACIVRIMKDRKTLSHNELVSEVARQLLSRFSPSPATIKKRIENLIDREYLEREGMKTYNYLA